MRRIERVQELILREIGSIVARELDVVNILTTFTRVELSRDIRYADIYFLTIPDDAANRIAWELKRNIFLLQQSLNKRLRMRPVPQIRFHIDKREQEAAKIDELLERV